MPVREYTVPEPIMDLASPVRQFVHLDTSAFPFLHCGAGGRSETSETGELEVCDVTPRDSEHGEPQTTGRRIRPRTGFAGGRPFLATLTMRFASLSESWRTVLVSASRLAEIT